MISVTAPAESPRAEENRKTRTLPGGAYLVKIYIDRERKTRENIEYELGKREFVGQVEIKGNWRQGYQPPKIIKAPQSVARKSNDES